MPSAILVGRAGSPGVGVGRVLLVADAAPTSSAVASAAASSSHDPAVEAERLRVALSAAADELTALAAQTSLRAGEEVGAIFEAQALFARDPGIVDPALAAVAAGASADEAIIATADAQADQLAAVDDDYFRERAADVRDVGRRVAGLVRGDPRPDLWHADGRPAVLVATDLDPSAVAGLRRELVAGIALAGGAPTGHAAIVARALGIPLVLGLGSDLAGVAPDATVAVDGAGGRLLIEPGAGEVARLLAEGGPADPASGPLAATHGVDIAANIASSLEAEAAIRAGADAIGLVRTELLFLGRSTPPTVAEQRATYARIVAAADGRPVVFRTLDVGGDKPAAWQTGAVEANPALGVRGVRLGRRVPGLLEDQLQALVEAVADGDLRVMLPMVATREELDDARVRLDNVVEAVAAATGTTPRSIQLGVMIEVPSAALMVDVLAGAADFFSIGTNDLVQYTLAADRTNPDLADLASAGQPAVLRLIDLVVRAARTHGRHVAVCGEAAADPSIIPFLVGLGVQELSVSPGSVARVRSVVAGLDPAACLALATTALTAGTLAEVQGLLD